MKNAYLIIEKYIPFKMSLKIVLLEGFVPCNDCVFILLPLRYFLTKYL
jgi:hypothetical protein